VEVTYLEARPSDVEAIGEELLIRGKLRVPASRADRVSRASLIERARAAGSRVVSVVAPAGYGKSTFLAEWAVAERRSVAWARLDSFDDDPGALFALLAAAAGSLDEDATRLGLDLALGRSEPLRRGAPLLAAALRDARRPFALFIDDAHEVGSSACEDLLDVILAAVPEGSVAVLASRRSLPYLARHRVAGDVFEVGVDDLRMDLSEARSIAETLHVAPSEDELGEWVRRCDGWPTGLFLCALIARDGGQPLHGADPRISHYLYRECLLGLPEELRDFLLRTSVLEQLSSDSCDAVRGATDSARWLRELDERGLFLIPLDRERGEFRYHDLFREFLSGELAATMPGETARLNSRAADWYVGSGMPSRAIEHSFRADDPLRAARLLAETGLEIYQRGEVVLLDRWLKRLGDRVLQESPWTTVIAVWTALLQGSVPEAVHRTALLARIHAGDRSSDAAALESQRAMIRAATCIGTVSAGVADAEFAARAEPPTSPWLDQALHLHGAMLVLSGDRAAAEPVFLDAARVAQDAGNADTVLLSEADLALLAIEDGDWDRARRHADAALEVVAQHRMDGYATSAMPYAIGARLAARRGQTAEADRLLQRAMRARTRTSHLLPVLAVQSRIHMAHAWLACDDHTAARAMLEEIDEVIAQRPHLGTLIADVEALRARLVSERAASGSVPLTPAELRLLPYLQTHLSLKEIGMRLSVSRNTVNSQTAAIYRKLGVGTRSAAVDEASRLGLLGA
jgi:LuxR family maltose regulon positive regulatory protein